jgi:hypothetical protein
MITVMAFLGKLPHDDQASPTNSGSSALVTPSNSITCGCMASARDRKRAAAACPRALSDCGHRHGLVNRDVELPGAKCRILMGEGLLAHNHVALVEARAPGRFSHALTFAAWRRAMLPFIFCLCSFTHLRRINH